MAVVENRICAKIKIKIKKKTQKEEEKSAIKFAKENGG